MRNLFAFIYRYRGFLVFSLLEVLCVYLIITNNTYQSAAFYHSANQYSGQLLAYEAEVQDYFRLNDVNRALALENAQLRQRVVMLQQRGDSVPDPATALDSAMAVQYVFRSGKVINNSIRRLDNYLTLNVGQEEGIEPGMGVISEDGVVGRVKVVSKHFATVTSVLHSHQLVSAKLRKDNTFGTVKWDGDNYREVLLDYIPLHVQVKKGDTVVTSGQTGVFPEGIMVGRVVSVEREQDKSFYTIRVQLAVDLAKLSYVYVVRNLMKPEQDSLEAVAEQKGAKKP